MGNDHTPRMSNKEYFGCLERAAMATSSDDVQRIRLELTERWRGDPRADDLAETLYAHQERLVARAGSSKS